MLLFTIRCDPELFLVKYDGTPLSAYGAVKGTKDEPYKVPSGAIQVDGMALEFNTDPVNLTNNFNQFNMNINNVVKTLKEAVKDNGLPGFKTAKLKIVPVQDFGEEIMSQTPDEAKELGCDPDYSAYTKEPNPRPDGEVTFRTASGHIHIGWGADIPVDHPDHIDICCDFIKVMDAHVGLFMTLIETDGRRRELYGKAGAFRPKPYGVEYRTPSNEWLTTIARRRTIYELTNMATTAATSTAVRNLFCDRWAEIPLSWESEEAFQTEVQRIINEGDKDMAYKLLKNRLRYSYPTQLIANVNNEYKALIKKKAA